MSKVVTLLPSVIVFAVQEDHKPELIIGGIFPHTGSSFVGEGILTASIMAVNAVSNSNILKRYQLRLIGSDGMCQPDMVMRAYIKFMNPNDFDKLIGLLGPACSDTVEPIAGVAKYHHTMIISYAAEGSSFSNRQKYPYFFRTIGENIEYKHVFLQLFQKMGWKHIYAFTEDGQKYTEYISHMHEFLKRGHISIANHKFSREWTTANLAEVSKQLIVFL